jgi:hypothetical protein
VELRVEDQRLKLRTGHTIKQPARGGGSDGKKCAFQAGSKHREALRGITLREISVTVVRVCRKAGSAGGVRRCYRSHVQGQTSQLQYVGHGHAHEMQLAK